MDDYVFLKSTAENEKLLRRASELGVSFLKDRRGFVTISQREVEAMAGQTIDKLQPPCRVLAVQGVAENLYGTCQEVNGTRAKVDFEGYKRTYQLEVDLQDVVPDDGRTNIIDPSSFDSAGTP